MSKKLEPFQGDRETITTQAAEIAEQAAEIARLNDALDEARDSMLCAISSGYMNDGSLGWLRDGIEDIKKAKEAGR